MKWTDEPQDKSMAPLNLDFPIHLENFTRVRANAAVAMDVPPGAETDAVFITVGAVAADSTVFLGRDDSANHIIADVLPNKYFYHGKHESIDTPEEDVYTSDASFSLLNETAEGDIHLHFPESMRKPLKAPNLPDGTGGNGSADRFAWSNAVYDRLLYPRMELQQAQADTADLALVYVKEYAEGTCGVLSQGLGYRNEASGLPLFWSPSVSARVDAKTGLSARSTRGSGARECGWLGTHISVPKPRF